MIKTPVKIDPKWPIVILDSTDKPIIWTHWPEVATELVEILNRKAVNGHGEAPQEN